ncbi:MAG: hypothetical protein DSM106950_28350 [Stigonema ocellatum SAG 48.90 = DSM 106950]|nr:hypothetical protein [Stigonema ocellatum SAG 48.90 = DSM 106950]
MQGLPTIHAAGRITARLKARASGSAHLFSKCGLPSYIVATSFAMAIGVAYPSGARR